VKKESKYKNLTEDCSECGRNFLLTEPNCIFIKINKKYIKKTDFINHEHTILCSKCAKNLLRFIKKYLKNSKNLI